MGRIQLANPCSEWGRFKTPTRSVTDSNPCSHCTPVPRFPKGSRGKVRNVGTAHQKKAGRKAHRRTLAKASRRYAAPEDAQNGQSWPHRWRITCQRRALESWAHQSQPAVHSQQCTTPATTASPEVQPPRKKRRGHRMTPTARKVLAHIPHRPEFRLSPSDIGRRINAHHANVRRALRSLVASGTLAIIDEPQRPHNAPGHYRGATR